VATQRRSNACRDVLSEAPSDGWWSQLHWQADATAEAHRARAHPGAHPDPKCAVQACPLVTITVPQRTWSERVNATNSSSAALLDQSDLSRMLEAVQRVAHAPFAPVARIHLESTIAASICGDGLCSPSEVKLSREEDRIVTSCEPDCFALRGVCTQREIHDFQWPTHPRAAARNPHAIYWLPRTRSLAQVWIQPALSSVAASASFA
jgi:hypothetical protein